MLHVATALGTLFLLTVGASAAEPFDKKEAINCILDNFDRTQIVPKSMGGGLSPSRIDIGECDRVRAGITECAVEITLDTAKSHPWTVAIMGAGPHLAYWRFIRGPTTYRCEALQ